VRVFLVDDEDIELFGMEKMLLALHPDIVVCGTARNGEEGIAKILQLQPDLVVSDVKMPKMDGVAMTRILRENGYSGEIVFISGYQDFTYAREAVRLGARDYLLKPVSKDELSRILSCVTEDGVSGTGSAKSGSNPCMEQKDFMRKLFQNEMALTEIYQKAAAMGLYLESGIYSVMVISPGWTEDEEAADGVCLQLGIPPCILMEQRYLAVLCHFSSIVTEEMALDHLTLSAERFLRKLDPSGRKNCRVGISEEFSSLQDARAYYQQACYALVENQKQGVGRLSFFEEATLERGTGDISDFSDEVIDVLASGAPQKVSGFVEKIFNSFPETYPWESILGIVIEIVASAILAIRKRIPSDKSSFSTHEEYRKISKLSNRAQLQEYLQNTLLTLMEAAFLQKEASGQTAAEQIKEIIDTEYFKDLSVEWIADCIHFSTSYTRRVFKNKMGITVMDYLQSVRMEKAREYLTASTHKVYEIGSLVGYENPSYFSLVFRKYYGVSPGDFRKQFFGGTS